MAQAVQNKEGCNRIGLPTRINVFVNSVWQAWGVNTSFILGGGTSVRLIVEVLHTQDVMNAATVIIITHATDVMNMTFWLKHSSQSA